MNLYHKSILLILAIFIFIFSGNTLWGQTAGEIRWLHIGQHQQWISENGSMTENGRIDLPNNNLIWPGLYGRDMRNGESKSLMIGVNNYYDPVLDKEFDKKVVQVGGRYSAYQKEEFFVRKLKCLGKFDHPLVFVDNVPNSYINEFDKVEQVDSRMKADRKVINELDSQIGININREVRAYSSADYDDIIFFDYTFTNNGVINENGDVEEQTLEDVYFYFGTRYAFAGEGNPVVGGTVYNTGFAPWSATWGRSNIFDWFTPDNPVNSEYYDKEFKGYYGYFGPATELDLELAAQWGLPDFQPQQPDQKRFHRMAAANYNGVVVLHADKSAADTTNDSDQPAVFPWHDADIQEQKQYSPYDANLMAQKYDIMTGKATKANAGISQQELMEQEGVSYAENLNQYIGGGIMQALSFGPYTLEPGEDVNIAFAEVVNGLNREKNREVAHNWFQYFKGTGNTPRLVLPDGSETSDHNQYKKTWVETALDSVIKSMSYARRCYDNNYEIPRNPPPPGQFFVQSMGDGIGVKWSADDQVENFPGFDGYTLYRCRNTIADEFTEYVKIMECDKSELEQVAPIVENNMRMYSDLPDTTIENPDPDSSIVRGMDYLYYLQAKTDGSNNKGQPLYSGAFYNMTGMKAKARLLRPAVVNNLDSIVVVPNPYVITNRSNQFGETDAYDRIAFYNLPPECTIKIFTERGDLIKKLEHTDGSGDHIWNQLTSTRITVVSGIYIILFETPEGKSVYRKLIVIR